MRLPTFLFVLVFLASSASIPAQTGDLELKGGAFTWQGKRVEVSAEELSYHASIVARLGQRFDEAGLVEAAWARAIRVKGAEAAGLTVNEEKFEAWMRDRYAQLLATIREEDPTPAEIAEIWEAYVRQRGFENGASYLQACREEYLGELFVALEFPVDDISEDALRERFRQIHTAYTVKTLVFSGETLENKRIASRENPEDVALFKSWWQSLSETQRRVLDDLERPAAEADALYFQFSNKSRAELEEAFERKHETTGKSFADLTEDLEMSPLEEEKMLSRWVTYRRSTYAHINGELDPGLDDVDSFQRVRNYLEQEWKIIRLLGRIWEELRALPEPADIHGAAMRYGFEFRHVPFQASHRIQADVDGQGVLAGDHPLGFRRTRPGEIFDYNTRPESRSKVYYVEGVVDQPGLHASIWRLNRFEGQRLLSDEQAMNVAWERFQETNDFRLALEQAARFAASLEARVNEKIAEEGEVERAERKALESRVASELFGDYFDERKGLVKGAEVIGPFVVRPFEEIAGIVRARGEIEQRVYDFVLRDWPTIVGPLGTELREGQIVPLARSNERRLAAMLRIEKIHPPAATQFERDPAGRRRAAASLRAKARTTRAGAAQTVYRYPRIMQHFALEAPQLNELMTERMKKELSVPVKKNEDGK